MRTHLVWISSGMAAIVCIYLLSGCTDDFNSPCDFPRAPEVQRYCGTSQNEQGNESFATCVDPFNPDCQTQLCVIFQGSDSYCSEHCDSTSDCPPAATCEFPAGSSRGICVPDELR